MENLQISVCEQEGFGVDEIKSGSFCLDFTVSVVVLDTPIFVVSVVCDSGGPGYADRDRFTSALTFVSIKTSGNTKVD